MFYCLSLGVYAGAKKGAYSDKMLRERIESKGQKDMPIDAVTEEMLEAPGFYLKKKRFTAKTVNRDLCWLNRLMYRAVGKRIIRW